MPPSLRVRRAGRGAPSGLELVRLAPARRTLRMQSERKPLWKPEAARAGFDDDAGYPARAPARDRGTKAPACPGRQDSVRASASKTAKGGCVRDDRIREWHR